MDKETPDTIARAVTRAVGARAGLSILLLLASAPCCLWAAMRCLERGLPELWSFAPMVAFVLLAGATWTKKFARWALILAAGGLLTALYFILR